MLLDRLDSLLELECMYQVWGIVLSLVTVHLLPIPLAAFVPLFVFP